MEQVTEQTMQEAIGLIKQFFAVQQPEKLIDVIEVASRLNVCKDQVWRLNRDKNHEFPKPVKIKKSTKWRELEINEYIRKLPKAVYDN